MSVILDALKKAQESRKKQNGVPSSQQGQADPSKKRVLIWVGSATLLLVAAVIVAIVLLSGSSKREVAQVVAPIPAGVKSVAPEPAKVPPPVEKTPNPPQQTQQAGQPGVVKEKGAWITDRVIADPGKAPVTDQKKVVPPRAPVRKEAARLSQSRTPEGEVGSSLPNVARRESYDPGPRREQSAFDAAQDRAAALAEAGRLTEARQVYTKLLAEQPGHPEILNNLGVIALRERRTDEALYYFSKALDIRKDYPKALNNVGLALMAQGNQADAERYFREAIAVEPNSVEPRLNLAALLRGQKRLEEASGLLRGLVEKNPPQSQPLLSYALIRDDAGDGAGAIRYYRQYLANAPFGPERNTVIERLKVLENAQSAGSR
jgi:Tfp pilus assembly protein PilF